MIRAIIVDDEQPSLDKLEKLLLDSGMVAIEGKFIEPLDSLTFLKENKVDVVFLDIEMPDMDGIELSSNIIDLQEGIAVVFVTAYNQYAVEAFRLNALDYLMKPVSANRLIDTLNRINEEKRNPAYTGRVLVKCFGRFEVNTGLEDVKFRTEKAEELLAYLIDRRGSFVSRSDIIDNMWGDFDGDRALIHFNTTLHYVKKALLSYGITISIQYDRGGYRLNRKELSCDYLIFCSFIERAEVPSKDNILEFEKMASLYTGEYLSGWEYDWAAIKRLLLEEKYICMMLEMAQYYESIGNYQNAAKSLKAGILREPLHRELNYRLIEVLLQMNERVLALRYYDIYRNGFINKLKKEPDETFRLLLH